MQGAGMTAVVTLHLDSASQAHFEAMRQRYFPTERNQIPAHLSLFHTLPATEEVAEVLEKTAASIEPFSLAVNGLRSLGKGVAYTLVSPPLQKLHASLATAFAPHLTRQDQQRLQPHIVIQNKVTSEAARVLLATLQAGFHGFAVDALGLDLWEYLGGPWRHLETFRFNGPQP